MKKIIFISTTVVLVILFVWFNGYKNQDIIKYTQNKKIDSTLGVDEARFTGIIQEVKDQRPVDGNLRVKVNDIWIVIGGGDMVVKREPVVINFDMVNVYSNAGKMAEVYAKKTGYDQSLTILDDEKYYIRIIK